MLTAFACLMMGKMGYPNFCNFKKLGKSLEAAAFLRTMQESELESIISKIDWVHHVLYHSHKATTLALNNLDLETVITEIKKAKGKSHNLVHMGEPIETTLQRCLDGSGNGWINIRREIIRDHLPDLAELGTVVVSDSKGGQSLIPRSLCKNLPKVNQLLPPKALQLNLACWENLRPRPSINRGYHPS
ncbi:hypothetical protein [Xanthomonas euvesicatoria]|uniref:hypothetical protein n=1 Tax=Xanthomonas euvesicatoria TaxID=456327 RepID=UPI000F8C5820|nr:hypothetical protein [Xanthomonas euvesicatoria]